MKPNILMILLDGARSDRLNISTEFEELKKEGILFNNVTAAYPYTFAAMNAIFTGLFGKENGVDAYYKMFKFKDNVDFLPELLQKNGYHTSCNIISDKVISKRGFDIFQAHDEYQDDLLEIHPKLIKKLFQESKNKPIFTFLQFSKIHTVTVSEILKKYEWNDEEFYKNKEKNLENYDLVFSDAVKYAKKIYSTIKSLGKLNETIIIFFTDHGTGVGERFGERNYGVYTFEETIKTFYLFIGPKIRKNVECDKLLSSIDMYPTILDLGKVLHKRQTKNISNYIFKNEENVEENYVFTETGGLQGPHPSPKKPNVFCIKSKNFKLIYFSSTNEWSLFNLITDTNEENNIYDSGLEIEKELKEKLLEWVNRK